MVFGGDVWDVRFFWVFVWGYGMEGRNGNEYE